MVPTYALTRLSGDSRLHVIALLLHLIKDTNNRTVGLVTALQHAPTVNTRKIKIKRDAFGVHILNER